MRSLDDIFGKSGGGVATPTKAKSLDELYGKPSAPEPQQDQGFNPLKFAGDAMTGLANAGIQASGEVARGMGNLVNTAGQIGSYLDPIADAKRVVQTFNGGNGGVFDKYESPLETVGGTVKKGTDWLADTTQKQAKDFYGQFNSNVKNDEDVSNWGGKLLGQGAGLIATSALTPTIKLPGASVAAGAAPTIANKAAQVGQFVGNSAVNTTAGIGFTQGRIPTMGELGTGLAFDTALWGIPKLLKGAKDVAGNAIAGFTRKESGKLASQYGDEFKDIISQNLDEMNLPITNSRAQIADAGKKQLNKIYTNLSGKIDDAIEAGAGTATIDDLLGNVDDIFSPQNISKTKLNPDQIDAARQKVQDIADFYRKTYGDKALNLADQQALKESLSNAFKGTSAIDNAESLFRKNLRSSVQKNIENEASKVGVEGVADLNKNYGVMKQWTSKLKNTGAYSPVLTDVITGATAGAGGGFAGGGFNPQNAVKAAIAAVLLKHGLYSDAGKIAAMKGADLLKAGLSSTAFNLAKPLLRTKTIESVGPLVDSATGGTQY